MKRSSRSSIRWFRLLRALGLLLTLSTSFRAYGNGEPASYLGLYAADAIFIMEKVSAHQGDTVTLTMSIESWRPLQGFHFAILIDARKLDLLSVTPIHAAGSDWDVFDLHVLDRDNTQCTPQRCLWRDDVWGEAVFSQNDPAADLPAQTRNDVLRIELKVHEDAPPGFVDVGFSELSENPDDPGSVAWPNDILSRDLGTGHVFYSDVRFLGGVLVDPPVGVPFLRGDVNGDGQISIADAMMLRRQLFQDGPLPPCVDTEDVDDNGSVQITDAVRILNHVILTSLDDLSQIASPYPEVALDGKLDALPCDSYPVVPPEETGDLVRLGAVEAAPGEDVEVPIFITSTVPVEAIQLFVSYDPALFVPRGNGFDLSGTVFEGRDAISFNFVNGTLAPGLLAIGYVGNLVNAGFEYPAGVDVLAGKLKGTISASVLPGTEVRLDLTNGPDGQGIGPKKLRNELTSQGESRLVSVVPHVEGMLFGIVSDITFFRGDSNSDQKVNLSDALATLGYLFLGDEAPVCPDAADANDNGVIEMSDAVLTLNFLFLGTGSLAQPYPGRGHDVTPDALGHCLPPRS